MAKDAIDQFLDGDIHADEIKQTQTNINSKNSPTAFDFAARQAGLNPIAAAKKIAVEHVAARKRPFYVDESSLPETSPSKPTPNKPESLALKFMDAIGATPHLPPTKEQAVQNKINAEHEFQQNLDNAEAEKKAKADQFLDMSDEEAKRYEQIHKEGRVGSAMGALEEGYIHPFAASIKDLGLKQGEQTYKLLRQNEPADISQLRAQAKESPTAAKLVKSYDESIDPRHNMIYQVGQKMDEYIHKNMPPNPKYQHEFLTTELPKTIGNFIAYGEASQLSGGTADIPMMMSASAQQEFDDALAHNASMDDAIRAADLARPAGAIPAMPFLRFSSPVMQMLSHYDNISGGVVSRILRESVKQGTEFSGAMGAQTLAQNLIAAKVVKYDPKRNVWHDVLNGSTFTTGALLGAFTALFHAPAPAISRTHPADYETSNWEGAAADVGIHANKNLSPAQSDALQEAQVQRQALKDQLDYVQGNDLEKAKQVGDILKQINNLDSKIQKMQTPRQPITEQLKGKQNWFAQRQAQRAEGIDFTPTEVPKSEPSTSPGAAPEAAQSQYEGGIDYTPPATPETPNLSLENDTQASRRVAQDERIAAQNARLGKVKLPPGFTDPRLKREDYRAQLTHIRDHLPADTSHETIQPAHDDILTAIAKAGGLDRKEAEAQRIDPAQFKDSAPGLFPTKGGKSFDAMAETLAQHGYTPENYSANDLLQRVDRAIRGEFVGSTALDPEQQAALKSAKDTGLAPHQVQTAITKALDGEKLGVRQAKAVTDLLDAHTGERTAPERLQYHQDQLEAARKERRAVAQGFAPIDTYADAHAGELFPEEAYLPEMDGQARALYEIIKEARQVDSDKVDTILERHGEEPDRELAKQLYEVIANGKPETPREEATAGGKPASNGHPEGQAGPGERVRAETEKTASKPEVKPETAEPPAKSLDETAHEAATSPKNETPEPTKSQKEAGNYRKGHIHINGLDIAIENPVGSRRRPEWPPLKHHYGYIKGTIGKDKDHIDVFLGPDTENPDNKVYIVDQANPKTGRFDEHKVMLGFKSEIAARSGYKANYTKGWKGLRETTAMSLDEFKTWLKEGDTTKPAKDWKNNVESTAQYTEKTAASVSSKIKPRSTEETGKAIPKEKVIPSEKITDFGEKIEGARKDVWKAYADNLNKTQDVAAEPLSKSWPEADYQKMIDDGADPRSVAIIRSLRDEIPPKPRQKWKLKQWAGLVTDLRDFASKLISGDFTLEQMERALGRADQDLKRKILGRVALYEAVGHDKSLKGVTLDHHYYAVYNGEKNVDLWSVEKKAKATAFSNWPNQLATGKTREEAIDKFKKAVKSGALDTESKSKNVRFNIYSYRRGDKKGKWFIGKKVGRDYLDLESFDTPNEARDYLAKHQDELVAKLAKYKEIPDHRKESNSPRVGIDHRNGDDVSPQQFQDKFGFRGVQFGNWVEQGRRQQDLNNAYDALLDMAGILDLPPQALSLNGELGLAFGARGKGKEGNITPSAHYEPGNIVINLTKTQGAGSLAHEWWHALDNYFSRSRKAGSDYMTEKPYERGPGVRPEIVNAYKEVMQTIKKTRMQQRSHLLDKGRSKEYWTTNREMSARAFESYIIEKLKDNQQSNDYLANIVGEDYWNAAAKLGLEKEGSYPYPEASEIPAIRAAFDNFFRVVETKKTDTGVMLHEDAALYSGYGNSGNLQSQQRGVREPVKTTQTDARQGDLFDPKNTPPEPTQAKNQIDDNFFVKYKQSPVKTIKSATDEVNSPEEAAHVVAHLRRNAQEEMLAIVTDKKGKILNIIRHTKGTRDGSTVDPSILIPAITATPDAKNVWFAHNHPSGVSEPSSADINITNKLAGLLDGTGIDYQGHVIVSGGRNASAIDLEGGHGVSIKIPPGLRNKSFNITERVIRKRGNLNRPAFTSPVDAAKYIENMKSKNAILLLDNRHRVSGIVTMTAPEMEKLREGDRINRILRAIDTTNSNAYMVVSESHEAVNNVARFLLRFGDNARVLDGFVRESEGGVTSLATQGKFPPEQGVFFSRAKEVTETPLKPIFYSPLERAVDNIKQLKGTGDQMLAQIKKTPGVKQEEMDWIGLDDYLKSKKTVTKQEIQRFVRDGGVQVQEVIKGEPITPADMGWKKDGNYYTPSSKYRIEVGSIEYLPSNGRYIFNSVGGSFYVFKTLDEAKEEAAIIANNKRLSDTKYSQYTLPGGENYREILLTLPGKQISFEQWNKNRESMGKAHGSREEYNHLISEKKLIDTSSKFKSGHFKEPNIIAHVRFNSRVDSDGKKVLFIEEVQSDWHQEGRKKGYNENPQYLVVGDTGVIVLKKGGEGPAIYDSKKEAEDYAANHEGWSVKEVPGKGVANAPFKQSWPLLAMKRMIRYATDHGYDRVAWTTGEQQAERYDLSKQVKAIDATKYANGTYGLIAHTIDDRKRFIGDPVAEDKLSDYVGKDLADKIIKQEKGSHLYTGTDIKIGGEGMKGFYDNILPKMVDKYVKKFGGKVDETTINEWEGEHPETGEHIKAGDQVHSFDITPKMREFAQEGQPLFRRSEDRGQQVPVKDIQSVIDALEKQFPHIPKTKVVENMQDPNTPADVRSLDEAQRSQGATGDPEGFYHGQTKTVYLVRDGIKPYPGETMPQAIMRVWAHEMLGHAGLRGAFGKQLIPILREVIAKRRADVEAKANSDEYKFDMNNEQEALAAAEEVLAELAQTQPHLSIVKRAIEAIRRGLRAMYLKLPNNVKQKLGGTEFTKWINSMTDEEMIQRFIEPARRYIETGKKADEQGTRFLRPQENMAFSRTPDTQARYDKRIDELFNGAKANYRGIKMLDKSDMLDLLGYNDKPVYLEEGKVTKGLYHHGLTAADWKKIPEWLDRPAMVFESDTVPGRLLAFAPDEVNGKPVVMILDPTANKDGLKVNLMVNAYDKIGDRIPMKRWIQDGLLKYYDKKLSPAILGRSGLQLPGLPEMLRGSREKVYTNKDLVKYQTENNPKTMFSRAKQAVEETTEKEKKGIRKAYTDMADKVIDRVDDAVNGLSHLSDRTNYMTARMITMGQVGESMRVAREVYETFKGLDEKNSHALLNYFEDTQAKSDSIPDAKLRPQAERVKKLIDAVGQTLVDRGVISQESYEKYQGRYLPRLYLAHLLGGEAEKAAGSGKLLSRMGYTKARNNELDKEYREIVLGQIKDPAFLASRAIGLPMRDMAIMGFLEKIASNKNWVAENQLVDWEMPGTGHTRKVTPWWLKNEADRMRQMADYVDPARASKMRQLADKMDSHAREVLDKLDYDHNRYRQIPDTARYGALRGMVVERHIFDDLSSTGQFGVGTENRFEAGMRDFVRYWKWTKVVANPPSQVRNIVSNFVMVNLSGVPWFRIGQYIPEITHQLAAKKGVYYDIARKYGLMDSSFNASEIGKIQSEMLDMKAQEAGSFSLAHAAKIGAAVHDWTGDLYQNAEMLGKLVKIKHAMEVDKIPEAEAVLEATKWLFDYSLIHKNIRYLRTMPIGAPFITYQVKVLPRLLEVAIKHPWRFLPYVLAAQAMPMMIANMYNVDKKDVDALDKALPEWLQNQQGAYFLPIKDSQGRWQAVNLGYFFPWTAWTTWGQDIGQNAKDLVTPGASVDNLSALATDAGMMSGPIPDLIAAATTNKDPFTQREIVDPNAPGTTQWAQRFNYVYSMMMPPWLTDMGVAGHLYRSLTQDSNRWGDPIDSPAQALLRLGGVNTYPIEPEKSRALNMLRMANQIKQTKASLRFALSDRRLTAAKRQEIINEYKPKLEFLAKQLREYEKASRINPLLK